MTLSTYFLSIAFDQQLFIIEKDFVPLILIKTLADHTILEKKPWFYYFIISKQFSY